MIRFFSVYLTGIFVYGIWSLCKLTTDPKSSQKINDMVQKQGIDWPVGVHIVLLAFSIWVASLVWPVYILFTFFGWVSALKNRER